MRKLFTVLVLLAPFMLLAQATTEDGDITTPQGLIAVLTPIIVWIAIQGAKLIKGIAPVWILGLLVPLLSVAVGWLTTLVADDGTTWLIRAAAGFGAVFVNELYKILSGSSKK